MDNQNVSQAGQKSSFKYYMIMMMLGVSVMTALTSLLAPRVLTWWYESPAPNVMTAPCISAIDWAIQRLQLAQLISLIVGALLGLMLAFRFRSKPQSNPLNTR